MLIGIDASRSEIQDKTGTENYSKEIIQAILKLPEAKKHQFRLYVKNPIRSNLASLQGWTLKVINWPRLWTQGGLALELMKNPVDVLWVPAHTLPVLRQKMIKTVVTIHGLEYEFLPEYYRFPQKLWLNKSTEYAVKQADKIIAVSKWTKKQLMELLKADERKIKVVYEGVSEKFIRQGSTLSQQSRTFSKEYMRQVRYKYSLPKEYVLFVGTIQPRKNLVRLIEALPKGIELVIAGKLGWMYDEILKAAEGKQVKFIGRVADDDMAAIYRGARLFVWPSLMEGFGLPVLEAMSMGIPVIASNRGALPEVVGEAGLLVDPENTLEIAQAMKLVLENKELGEALVEKGYRQANKFSWEQAAKQTLAILTDWE
jgi:glycosyltransferase involved in cell wall biosynthesis